MRQLYSLLVSPLSWLQAVALRVLGWVTEATPLQTSAVEGANAASGGDPAKVIAGLRWGESKYAVCYKSSVSVFERADSGYRRDHHTLSSPAHLCHLADVGPAVVCQQSTAKCAGGATVYVAAATANGWACKQQRTGELRANTAFRGVSYAVVSFRLKVSLRSPSLYRFWDHCCCNALSYNADRPTYQCNILRVYSMWDIS